MRNQTTEAKILNEAEILCQRVYGEQPTGAFSRLVFDRLALGARVYGDSDYLTKDNLLEALDEGVDGAAYPLLDYQRVAPGLSEPDRAELRQFTLGVVAAAINLDTAIRRLRKVRDDML